MELLWMYEKTGHNSRLQIFLQKYYWKIVIRLIKIWKFIDSFFLNKLRTEQCRLQNIFESK